MRDSARDHPPRMHSRDRQWLDHAVDLAGPAAPHDRGAAICAAGIVVITVRGARTSALREHLAGGVT